MLPGGYSGGDEPIGSGRFAAAIFREPKVRDAARDLLFNRDGLILGIGSGFQALVKLGLLPYGDIKEHMDEDDPAIGINKIGRHQSYIAYTRVASVKSVWFNNIKVGDVHVIPVSHGEGRFYAGEDKLAELARNGQIAAQYCDINGEPTMHPYYNPNGSLSAVEAVSSPDGRILGKMGHSERTGRNILKNVPGNFDQLIFISGVRYFR
jgi:phosphoribosylformylglycinamidine synthase